MVVSVKTLGIQYVSGYEVCAECFLSGGLPSFDVVGLPDAAVRESRERVRAAVKLLGLKFPAGRVTVNLAPADRKKGGTLYDLPILVGLLAAGEEIAPPPPETAFLGELSLTGSLRPVAGVLPMALAAREAGIRQLFVPWQNAAEASLAEGVRVYGVRHVKALLAHLRGESPLEPTPRWQPQGQEAPLPDLADVYGQENAKRVLEIAAAGGHNVLLIGSPGTGKSMLAKRLPSILPDLTWEESLETSSIRSAAGLTDPSHPLLGRRPFQSPHHTVSAAALAGGGPNMRPGEMSLAHNGVLFLDELPEFRRDVLECMRQPLEDGVVTVARAGGTARFPARFQLVCAMNPCRCGWRGHPTHRCTCTEAEARKYVEKISGPLLDRIDLHIIVPPVEYESMRRRRPPESSAEVKRRVEAAREIQQKRYEGTGVFCNAQMPPSLIGQTCALSPEGETLLRRAFETMGLTARSHDRILRIARTIADLDGETDIQPFHVAEAVQYRDTKILKG